MKTLIFTLLCCCGAYCSQAQFLGGFFSQKKENRKLLGLQIAALQVYKSYIKKGYEIVSFGTGIISKIKSGDFNLHHDFFGALNLVNPRIKKYARVAEIMALNVEAVGRLKQISKLARSELCSSTEYRYLEQVVERLLQKVADTIDELASLLSDNQLQLKDDERIERIDRLYEKAQDQYSFTCYFGDEAALLVRMREKQQADIESSRVLNSIK